MKESILVRGAREHNLRNIDIDIPKNKVVVFSGVSGSGKSSLVFSTIYAESQRQLLDTFSAYTRSRMAKITRPMVDEIRNLPVAIVIDQKRLGRNSSSTVGTVTEIYNLVRLLYSRCGDPMIGDSVRFSFNRPEGMCPECRGSGRRMALNEKALFNGNLSLNQGAILHPRYKPDGYLIKTVLYSGLFDNDKPLEEFTRQELDTLLYAKKYIRKTKPAGVPFNMSFKGIINYCQLPDTDNGNEEGPAGNPFYTMQTCEACGGARLNREALSVRVAGKTISEICAMELTGLNDFLKIVPDRHNELYRSMAETITGKIRKQLDYLIKIGVGYLSLDRETATLSGGESQRVKMARQLDCDLTGLVYILDEPSIGLHPSDIDNLISIMRGLRDKGNSVLVIEHDSGVICSADHIIDVGPGGGSRGGHIVFEGDLEKLKDSRTLTSEFLFGKRGSGRDVREPSEYFEIRNARANNLKDLSLDIPAGVLVCVTGVAGSGKSTLINTVFTGLYPESVIIDQSAVTRSRRSTPVSYTKVLDLIRKEFSAATGKDPGLFSFNSIGRCPECNGLGEVEVEMHFLENVSVPCETCGGKRFRPEVLDLKMKGLNISEVLDLTVEDAIRFFGHREIRRRLSLLSDVGLGYLRLGQNLGTLSGGEAQRVKIGNELRKSGCIYIMDEPTTGLHMADTSRLVHLIHRLVDAGNSVIVIEHNLEIIAQADWIIDLGPGGGSRGGKLMARGTPEQICGEPESLTGQYLKEFLSRDSIRNVS